MGTRRAATANYYEILGVERNADHDVIKRAFLDRSLRFRRELRPGGSPQAVERAEYRLHETEEAWSVLRSPAARARYDDELRSVVDDRHRPIGRSPGAFGSAMPRVSMEDLPELEVLDAVEPVPAMSRRARRAGNEHRSRRWRLFATVAVVSAGAGLFSVTGAMGGRSLAAGKELHIVGELTVGSCVQLAGISGATNSAAGPDGAVTSVPCGTPDSRRVVGWAPATKPCPPGTRAVIITGGDENLCIV